MHNHRLLPLLRYDSVSVLHPLSLLLDSVTTSPVQIDDGLGAGRAVVGVVLTAELVVCVGLYLYVDAGSLGPAAKTHRWRSTVRITLGRLLRTTVHPQLDVGRRRGDCWSFLRLFTLRLLSEEFKNPHFSL